MAQRPEVYPVKPRGALHIKLRPPPARSIANRALVAAALAEGESRISPLTRSDDVLAMRAGLEKLGIVFVEDAAAAEGESWRVQGCGGRFPAAESPAAPRLINVGASGTTARFLTAAAALAAGPSTITGNARMRARPIVELAAAMQQLGAAAEVQGAGGCPPVEVAGGGVAGGAAQVDARRSSQFVSALLLAAPCARRDLELRLHQGALVSRPFVEMTLQVMRAFGARPKWRGAAALHVPAAGYRATEFTVEPDAQAAAYAFAAAAITGGGAVVQGLGGASTQPDLGMLNALEEMGCEVARGADEIRVQGPKRLRGIRVCGNAWPDAVLALAVAMLFAEGESEITGIANLRLKESNRLAALQNELQKLGARAAAGESSLHIAPGPLRAAEIESYDDHRMAMAFALAGLRVPGVAIRNPACVAKTWPGFFAELERW